VYAQPSVTNKSLGTGNGLYWEVVKAATREQLKTAWAALEAHNPEAVVYLKVKRCTLATSYPC